MTRKRLVIVESPFAPNKKLLESLGITDPERRQLCESSLLAENLAYLAACLHDCIVARGEAPFASHGLYPSCLDDTKPEERKLGIEAGLAWGLVADARVFYINKGISSGMRWAWSHAKIHNIKTEIRSLNRELSPDHIERFEELLAADGTFDARGPL